MNTEVDFIDIKEEITTQDNEELIREILDEEIAFTINQMANNKSPGSDVFTIDFFQKYWHITGKATCSAIKAFFYC